MLIDTFFKSVKTNDHHNLQIYDILFYIKKLKEYDKRKVGTQNNQRFPYISFVQDQPYLQSVPTTWPV